MNIAEILKNCPKGTPLYSPIFGECTFEKVLDNQITPYPVIVRERNTQDTKTFTDDGKYDYYGECMLFPSRENRDWNTFDKSEYKSGDVVITSNFNCCILHHIKPDTVTGVTYALLWTDTHRIDTGLTTFKIIRHANEAEKRMLFDWIEKEGYSYDPDKFILIRKDELFKPFDKVLVRDGDDERWEPDFFASAEEFSDGIRFNTITGLTRKQCIAYEGNEHLINTIINP